MNSFEPSLVDSSRILNEWTINQLKIQLVTESKDSLTYKIYQDNNQEINHGKVPISPQLTLEKTLDFLINQCSVVLLQSSKPKPHFGISYSVSKNSVIGNQNIKLLQIGNKLAWQWINDQNLYRWSAFDLSTEPSLICKKSTFDLFMSGDINQRITQLSNKFWISFIREKKQHSVVYKENKPTFTVKIEPIWAWSKINQKTAISTYRWGLTILTFGGMSGNHALFSIEGINENGSYFLRKVEFTGLEVRSDIFLFERLKYETQSKTWIRSYDKVLELLKDIEEQKINPPNFSVRGNRAWGNSDVEHSCITWLREQFHKIGIILPTSIRDKVFTRTKDYTDEPAAYENDPILRDI